VARIVGVDLPQNKRIEVALTYVFGVGRPRSKRILEKAGVDVAIKVKDLAEDEVRKIRDIIQEEGQVEGDLRKNIQMDIKRMIDIGCYRGLRHRRSLPVHGQRTHTNARTRKGPRKTVAGKKKAPGGKKG
jgi:small subunit ribosomal protein S13